MEKENLIFPRKPFRTHVIPDKVRIPSYITIVAGFVTVVQMLVKAFAPQLDTSLGIYLPLIVVNCIILGRAEMFANKNPVLPSVLDGLGMGVGFTAALLLMGSIRELLGSGTWFGMTVTANLFDPMLIFILPPGGFFVFGLLVALANKLSNTDGTKQVAGCAGCPMNATCSKATGVEAVSCADCGSGSAAKIPASASAGEQKEGDGQ